MANGASRGSSVISPLPTILKKIGAGWPGFLAKVSLCLFLLPYLVGAHAAPPSAGASIQTVARATYVPAGIYQTETAVSNPVVATVLGVEVAILTQDQSVIRPPGSGISLSHLLTNAGNVTSSYTLDLASGASGCPVSNVTLGSLRLTRDVNNNGVSDSADLPINSGTSAAVTLLPGQSIALLVSGTVPQLASGSACISLKATTALQGVAVVNRDIVTLGDGAVLLLSKSVSHSGILTSGQSRIEFDIRATNIGGQGAQPTKIVAPSSSSLTVNGQAADLVLLHDAIPAGTRYLPGSLQTTAPDAIRLYRRQGDPPFGYQTAEDPTAAEVAVGLPVTLAPNVSVSMQFAVTPLAGQTGDIANVAYGAYNNGVNSVESASNIVIVPASKSRVGISKLASNPVVNRNVDGTPDGTISMQFRVHIRNYGDGWLYGVQANDLLEGAGTSQFGAYTATASPGPGQYTVIPGSISVVGGSGVSANTAYTGMASSAGLLMPGAKLAPHADLTIQFDVRVNTTGRAAALANSAIASASTEEGKPASVFDDSVDGADPDPDGDGNPNNNTSTTFVVTQVPVLSFTKTASSARRVDAGTYEVDYIFRVVNNGSVPAPNVRVIDNLNCTFGSDSNAGVASWSLVGTPTARNGNLAISSGFTGRAVCNRAQNNSINPLDFPTELAVNITDGSRGLAPGQAEEITLTVRVALVAGSADRGQVVSNKAWAVALKQNSVGLDSSMVIAAAASAAESVLVDPQGVVYDANSRQPVAGVAVTLARGACQSGMTGAITAAQLFGGDSGAYRFNGDGSVSMTTGADGAYQFFLRSPPVVGLCTYGLAVTPPAGSSYAAPSQLIPVTPGVFSACGPVVPNATAPQASDPTTFYMQMSIGAAGGAGLGAGTGAACEVFHNHIPLDPGNVRGLVLVKEGSKRQVEFGDFLDYALTLTNKTGMPITGVAFDDNLPIGFAYVRGSAQLNGVTTANPVGGSGPQLSFGFSDLHLAPDAAATVRYRVRVGVGAPTHGDAVNRANARSGALHSNQANWSVRISGGVFADDAFAFGKVYLDCTRDGHQQGRDEVGVPGVRLFMENGTSVVTDVEGKWSLYGLKPVTHVLRVDETTLPQGAKLQVLDSRNAANPASRFLDLVKGEFHQADFIIGNCDTGVVSQVTARREAINANPNAEGEALIRTRLDPEGRAVVVGDTRGLPASGQASASGAVGSLPLAPGPLIALPTAPANASSSSYVGAVSAGASTLGSGNRMAPTAAGSLFTPVAGIPDAAQASSPTSSSTAGPGASGQRPLARSGAMLEPLAPPLLASPRPSPIELETVLPALADNRLGFIDLNDGETVPSQVLNVRVKGEMGVVLRLSVNGETLDEKRVGKKVSLTDRKIIAWEYIGVVLEAGANQLQLSAVDEFGNVRETGPTIRVVAPGTLGAIQLEVPASARADLRTPIPVRVRLVDGAGVPVTARTQLTLESDRGRWTDEDLNPQERGLQVFVSGGQADFLLLPPGEPGTLRIRASAGALVQEAGVSLLAELRPMIAVGVVEGVLDFRRGGPVPVGAVPAGAAFEAELSQLGSNGANARTSGRSAFFLKGVVKGDYLLTASFDSDKREKDRLFRDIRPDEFYPIYGDSSVRSFDAQSTQRLYVRIDKNRSYLLYGDFTTASSTEVRSLSQTNRTLTGAKQVYDDTRVRVTSYLADTSQTQQVEEFHALGISGPYFLSSTAGEFVPNSEQVEIVLRNKDQPDMVLQRTPMTRNQDYSVDVLTRRIEFMQPISSWDANLNPQSIRVTYEVESGGAKFVVAGTDAQFKITDLLQLGVVANTDRNPQNQRNLAGVTALARIGDNATVAAELVRTQSDEKGMGTGARAELRYQDDKLAAVALGSKTNTGFDNPGASVSAGRSDAAARAEYRIDPTLAVRGEALYTKDDASDQERSGATVSVQKKLNSTATVEAGVRYGQSTTALGTSSGFDYGNVSTYNGSMGGSLGAGNTTAMGAAAANASNRNGDHLATVRARISSLVPGLPGAQAFVEGEQSLSESDRQTLAVGANYALTDKTRAYGRYELISGLYGPYELGGTQVNNTGILGIESAYMDGGRVYNEYRLADSIDGRGVVAALGVRNTYALTPRIRVTGGLEHTRNLSSTSNSVNNGTGYGSVLGESTAITSGVEYTVERLKASAILEARDGSDSDTLLFSGGVAYKLNPEFSLLARSVVSDSKGQGASVGNSRQLQRHQLGVAYRPVDTNTWNALARYEHRTDKVVGGGNSSGSVFGNISGNANLPGTYTTDIVSTHVNYNPSAGLRMNSRYAVKVSEVEDGVLSSRYWAQLIQGRITRDIGKDWDIGFQAGALFGQGGARQNTMGAEVGRQVYRDIWVSGGYNFVGLTDRDLAANEYTSKGAYVRMRMKFDETALGFAPVDAAARDVVPMPAAAVPVPEALVRQPDAPALEISPSLSTPAPQEGVPLAEPQKSPAPTAEPLERR